LGNQGLFLADSPVEPTDSDRCRHYVDCNLLDEFRNPFPSFEAPRAYTCWILLSRIDVGYIAVTEASSCLGWLILKFVLISLAHSTGFT